MRRDRETVSVVGRDAFETLAGLQTLIDNAQIWMASGSSADHMIAARVCTLEAERSVNSSRLGGTRFTHIRIFVPISEVKQMQTPLITRAVF
jgi:hypothetical protein